MADFRKALLAELSDAEMPAAVAARVRGRLEASMNARSTWWQYPVVAVVACAFGVVLSVVVLKPPARRSRLGGLRVEHASVGLEAAVVGSDVVVRAGDVTLVDSAVGATVQVSRTGRLRREARGLRVVSGRVELEVAKRAADAPPMRVLVSHGEIEVHGTRFSVEQMEGGGGATVLFEGRILFRSDDGREVELVPGQSVAWPLPPLAPAPEKDKSLVTNEDDALAPLPPPVAGVDAGVDWTAHDRLLRAHTLLERIPMLRAQGRAEQAVSELEVAMTQDLPATARERLSFELVDLLANDVWNVEAACRYAKDHAWRYPAGRYDNEIVRMREELGCH